MVHPITLVHTVNRSTRGIKA